jgi:hypothetical protein
VEVLLAIEDDMNRCSFDDKQRWRALYALPSLPDAATFTNNEWR